MHVGGMKIQTYFLTMKIIFIHFFKQNTRGPMVLYRSPNCIRYAELELSWKVFLLVLRFYDPVNS